jgi:hypothetical protein
VTADEDSRVELSDDSGSVVAALEAVTPRPVAAGACWVELTVEARDRSIYLAVGSDRIRRRPAHLTMHGAIGGVDLADPAGGAAGAEGPSGPIPVEPGSLYRARLLVNQFLALENVPGILQPGEEQPLEVIVRRPLPLARTPAQALSLLDAPVLALRLAVPIRRDDDALEAEIAEVAAEIRRHFTESTSNILEDALATLVAYRLPQSRAALAELVDHPNPLVRAQAEAVGR